MIKVIFDEIYPSLKSRDSQVSVLKSIIEITEGKIYVEFEFSNAVRKLTEILLSEGNIEEATKLIQDIQIETFGSLNRVYKVEYILFQMKVLLQKGDFVRTLIVSNKIVRKHLNEPGLENLKVEFYNLMIKYNNHEEKYLEVSDCYKELYDYSVDLRSKFNELSAKGESQIDLAKTYANIISQLDSASLFERFVFFLNLCAPTPENKHLIKHLNTNYTKELEEYQLIGELIAIKLGEDIFPASDEFLSRFARSSTFINDSSIFNNGTQNFKLFRKYFIQHNLQIVSKFFSQISLTRISNLISVPVNEVESEICNMVTSGYLYARINRIKAIVSFRKKQNFDDKLNNLDGDLMKMLETLETTCHLIHKENLKYDIK